MTLAAVGVDSAVKNQCYAVICNVIVASAANGGREHVLLERASLFRLAFSANHDPHNYNINNYNNYKFALQEYFRLIYKRPWQRPYDIFITTMTTTQQ